jgi:hypothetical protein
VGASSDSVTARKDEGEAVFHREDDIQGMLGK